MGLFYHHYYFFNIIHENMLIRLVLHPELKLSVKTLLTATPKKLVKKFAFIFFCIFTKNGLGIFQNPVKCVAAVEKKPCRYAY